VIPAEIRERFMIAEGTKIAWVVRDDVIEVVPLAAQTWQELRGSGKELCCGKLLQASWAHRLSRPSSRPRSAAKQRS